MSRITMKVRLTGMTIFTVRIRLATWLIWLAARVAGMGLQIEDEPVNQIRYIGDLQRLQIQPGDQLVVKTKERLSQEAVDRLKVVFAQAYPGTKVMVLDAGMEMGVFSAPPNNSGV